MLLIHEFPLLCRQVFSFHSHNEPNHIKTADVEIHDESRYYVKEVHCHWAESVQRFHNPSSRRRQENFSKKISRTVDATLHVMVRIGNTLNPLWLFTWSTWMIIIAFQWSPPFLRKCCRSNGNWDQLGLALIIIFLVYGFGGDFCFRISRKIPD